MLKREDISQTLKKNIAILEFKKLDGTLRTMRCTLMPTELPEREKKENDADTPARPVREDVLCVFDLDKQEWRSLRVENLKSITLG